jgi:hypothetical protein
VGRVREGVPASVDSTAGSENYCVRRAREGLPRSVESTAGSENELLYRVRLAKDRQRSFIPLIGSDRCWRVEESGTRLFKWIGYVDFG